MKPELLIYLAIILISIIAGLSKKKNKPTAQSKPQQRRPQQQQQTPKPRQKTLEEIIRELTEGIEQKQKPAQPKPTAKVEEKKDSPYYTYDQTSVDIEDPEDPEFLADDETEDHHVHGKGFDVPFDDEQESVLAEVESRYKTEDWKKAIVMSEILKRPQY